MIAGVLGVLGSSSPVVPGPSLHATAMKCPAAKSTAHRPLLVQADAQVDAGEDGKAARSFVAGFDAMDLADQVGSSGKFAADRAATTYLKAWRIKRDVVYLEEGERFIERYLETAERGRTEGCAVINTQWADDKLAEIRAEMPTEPAPVDPPPGPGPKPPAKDCPAAPAIIGVDRVGVTLVTIGASLFVSGTGLLVAGLVLNNNTSQALVISGSVIGGAGVALLIPGAVRLGTWKRRRGRAKLGLAPWTGPGLAGVTLGGRFGAGR